jgi:hypothetical protein
LALDLIDLAEFLRDGLVECIVFLTEAELDDTVQGECVENCREVYENEEGEEGPYSMLLGMRRRHWRGRGSYDGACEQWFKDVIIIGHNSSQANAINVYLQLQLTMTLGVPRPTPSRSW